MMNGHSDVMLGLLCGREGQQTEFRDTMAVWGMSSSPFDCWLALRGVATLPLRVTRASTSAAEIAQRLTTHPAVQRVVYPSQSDHPDHLVADRLFETKVGGSMVTFQLNGGRSDVSQFVHQAPDIPFCPSLGEVSTTLSHPASTSHRGLTDAQCAQLGIAEGTIRLSIGLESADWIWQTLQAALDALA